MKNLSLFIAKCEKQLTDTELVKLNDELKDLINKKSPKTISTKTSENQFSVAINLERYFNEIIEKLIATSEINLDFALDEKSIDFFPMNGMEIYISCFDGVKLGKERTTTVLKENDDIKYVTIEVIESKGLLDDKECFKISRDLKKNQVFSYHLQHKDNENDQINHCKLSLLGTRIITSEREYKDSAYADIHVYYFNAL